MSSVAVVTDSCASIPMDILTSLGISWVPYYIHRGQEVLRDLLTIQPDEFYKWLPTESELPTTASPGPGDYLSRYERIYKESSARQIVSIHMTSKGSGAYQAATTAQSMAQEMFPELRIQVIDTLNVSMCHGWMVIEAARAALAGNLISDICTIVNKMIPVTRMIQTADTLRYLYMGGRIGRAKHLVGTLLNIKPLISMEDGVILSLGQARSRMKAYQMIADEIEKTVGYMGKIKIAYVHAAAPDEVEKIRHLVEKRLSPIETIVTELSPALGVHTGPGTAGVCYFPAAALS